MQKLALDVLDNLLEGCQVIGFDWTYRYVNGAAAQQGREPADRLLGRTMMDCYPGIESTPMFAALRRCMSERAHHRMENEFTFPDGTIGWFELRFTPVPEGTCIFSLDITERRRAADALRRSEERLRLLIEGVRDHAMFALDTSGRVATWNAGAQRLWGHSEDEIVGADLRCFFPVEDVEEGLPEKELEAALANGSAEVEGFRLRKDGTRFWADAVVTPLRDPSGRHVGFTKITRDLTSRRNLEEQLRHAQKMEAVGRLAGGVAHDFNNMLSIILSYANLAAERLTPGDPLREEIEEIEAAGKRAAELTRQLLAFSRQQVTRARVIDLDDVVGRMEKMLGRLVGDDVTVIVRLAPGLGPVKADPGQIEQVVMNLVVNARDAMRQGGTVTVETANVELDDAYGRDHLGTRPGPHVMLAVSDTGIGMTPDVRARIFEPFYTTKPAGEGTGLGLSTVFGIVQQHGGSIWVYSEPGQGSTFKVYLPRAAESACVAENRPLPEPIRVAVETVLVVDDEARLRQLVDTILRRKGYSVLTAASPAEALQLSAQHGGKIDLLLTDVVMPGMNGRLLAARLVERRPGLRVLYMSGYTGTVAVHHGMLDEGIALLQKPITPDALARAVREALEAPSSSDDRAPAL